MHSSWRVAPRERGPAQIFRADTSRRSRFYSIFQRLAKTASRENYPCENRLAKLVNFANAAGRKRKSGADDGSGEICETRALENSTSRTRKFRVAILLLFPKRFSLQPGARVPKAEILYDGISDRCTLRKDSREIYFRRKLRSLLSKRSYRNTI